MKVDMSLKMKPNQHQYFKSGSANLKFVKFISVLIDKFIYAVNFDKIVYKPSFDDDDDDDDGRKETYMW